MLIEKIISQTKTLVAWEYFWHFFVFIGLFIISRIVLLPLLESSPPPFIRVLQNTLVGYEARLVYSIMGLFGLSKSCDIATVTFTNNHAIEVLWGCSGIRPLVTTFIIFLIVPGPYRQRLWFIPLTLGVMGFLVFLHLLILSLFIALKPGLYDFAHEWITKSMVYGSMFLLWLFWEEVLRRKNNKNKLSC